MATRGASNFATKDDLKGAVAQLGHELKVFREEVKGDLRALGVMVEQTNAHVRALAEGLGSTRDELTRKMSDLEERLSARITTLEGAVRSNSEDLRANTEGLRSLRLEVAELRLRFDKRDVQLEQLEERVAATEKRLGIEG